MSALQINCIEQSYYSARDERAKRKRGPLLSRILGPFELSDHMLRDIGVLDGQPVRAERLDYACSPLDLIDRYR
ncbi:hypothetical protein [Labrys neptuniae]